MNPDASPFTPRQPAGVDFFIGRSKEIEELRASVRRATAQRSLQIGWIAGERGIGKSSLASCVGLLAEHDEQALVAHVHLGSVDTLESMVRETFFGLLKDNRRKAWGETLMNMFNVKVRQIGFSPVEKMQIDMDNEELAATASNFVEVFGHIIANVGYDRKVLLLIFDDINGLADKPYFTHWLKSTMDSFATRRLETPICLVFVGLEERLDTMKKNNPSVIRVFGPLLFIQPWEHNESEQFFRDAFDERAVTIGKNNLELLAMHSSGLPTVAHEIGDSVWRRAKDNAIKTDDCWHGIFDAADSIGNRFIEKEVIQALNSTHYLSILGKIADEPDFAFRMFSKQEVQSLATLTSAEKKVLDNFLRRMVTLGGLARIKEGVRGLYRFPTYMHETYCFLKAKGLTKSRKPQR